jgi:hypothetical protein
VGYSGEVGTSTTRKERMDKIWSKFLGKMGEHDSNEEGYAVSIDLHMTSGCMLVLEVSFGGT